MLEVKSLREETTFLEELYLHLGLKDQREPLFSQYPKELCDGLCLIIQEKLAGNVSSRFDIEIVAIMDKILENKYITLSQHKKIKPNLILYNCFTYHRNTLLIDPF